MNAYIATQNIALGVVYLRNSRAITCDLRLDGNILSRNLLCPELISASLRKNPINFLPARFKPGGNGVFFKAADAITKFK